VTNVKVPSLKTLKLATAKSKITALGLKWKHVIGPGDGMAAVGFVYKQSPASGATVKKGSTVTIYTWDGK
jgi:beta-lactam-binding protein with PASTA domain